MKRNFDFVLLLVTASRGAGIVPAFPAGDTSRPTRGKVSRCFEEEDPHRDMRVVAV
jgi:hypothetical protein